MQQLAWGPVSGSARPAWGLRLRGPARHHTVRTTRRLPSGTGSSFRHLGGPPPCGQEPRLQHFLREALGSFVLPSETPEARPRTHAQLRGCRESLGSPGAPERDGSSRTCPREKEVGGDSPQGARTRHQKHIQTSFLYNSAHSSSSLRSEFSRTRQQPSGSSSGFDVLFSTPERGNGQETSVSVLFYFA